MVVIGHRDPLPGSPGSTVRLDRSISRGSDARPARSFGDLTGRYSLIEQQKDALAAEQGKGRKMPFPKGQPLPKWLRYGKEQLTFKAYFEEAVPGSQIESKRVRKCMLYYYLEDDCLQIFEPAEENSGLPQGCLVRRHRVPKPDGSYYTMSDLQIGAVIDVYKKMIHIYDCDDFTRKTLTERGLPVSNRLPSPTKQQLQGYAFDDELTVVTRNTEQVSLDEGSTLFPGCVPDTDALECPDDEYRALMRTKRAEDGLDQSISRRKVISPEIGGAREAQLGRAQVTVDLGLPRRTDLGTFLENDRKVLSFDCTWEDKALRVARRPTRVHRTLSRRGPRRYGDVSRFRLHYFLAEDAIEVIAVDKRSDDSAPKLLGKRKLLLPQYQHSVNTPTDKSNTYHWTDLAVGGEVIIFNRTLKIVDACVEIKQ
jgi:hypothetical protein